MRTITIVSKVIATPEVEALIKDAMRSATKVWNGLIWNLRAQYEQEGRAAISRKNLNKIMKDLPRRKEYYSLSAQGTRDEVIWAYRSYFELHRNGDKTARPPGFRKKAYLSNLRYYDGYGYKMNADKLKLSLGRGRLDEVKEVAVELRYRTDLQFTKVVHVLMTYAVKNGLQAHLVVNSIDPQPLADRVVAVDFGETQIISAMFDDGINLLYSGKELKSIRRYWNKVRRKVKPPPEGQRKSRRFRQIERKESRQINHRLHQISKDFVERCYQAGVATIVIGDLNGIRDNIQYGRKINQRLHAWSFAKLTQQITYKAALKGIVVEKISERNTSKTCHCCGKISKSNRKTRGVYRCECGWQAHADVNAAANIFKRFTNLSPVSRSSGAVAAPVVLPLHNSWHTVYAPQDVTKKSYEHWEK